MNKYVFDKIDFIKYLSPQYHTELVLCSKFSYGSQFSEEKNGLEISFLVPEILNKSYSCIIFETPCSY